MSDGPQDRHARELGDDKMATRVAIVTGVFFVFSGLPKFIAFHWEVGNFTRFGLSPPEAWVIAAGVIEMVGGALLVARRGVRAASVVLAVTMAVAIVVSGVRRGDVIPSLTLAPLLCGACLYLLVKASRRSRPSRP